MGKRFLRFALLKENLLKTFSLGKKFLILRLKKKKI